MEYKTIKNLNKDIGKFYGYASVFNVEDSYNDIILNGAFIKSLKNKSLDSINLLWQHNIQENIGKITVLKEDSVGLYVEGKINNIKKYSYVKNKFIDGLSIGYRANDYYFDKYGRRILKELELMEISIVSCPANRYSNISYCKSKSIVSYFC